MKKTKYLKIAKYAIIGLLLYTYIAMSFFTDPLVMVFVYIKHISLFLLVGIMVYYITNYISDHTIKRFQLEGSKETITHILKVVVFTGILVITSILQLGYIEYSDTPYIRGCRHYDTYGNVIYESVTSKECPTLDISLQTDTSLEFEVREINHAQLDSFKFEEDDTKRYDDVDIISNYFTSTKIEYDSDNRISEVYWNQSIVIDIDTDDRHESNYFSTEVIITNSYFDGYTQTIKSATIAQEVDETYYMNFNHQSFTLDDYQTTTYYTEDSLIDPSTILYKEHIMDDELTVEEVLAYSSSQENGIDTFDIDTILENLSYISRNTTLNISDESVTEFMSLNGDISNSLTERIFKKNPTYGYLKQSQHSTVEEYDTIRNNEYNYTLKEINNEEYVIRELTSDNNLGLLIDDKIYLLEETSYGITVKYLDFENDLYLSYLINGEDYTSWNYFLTPNYSSSTTVFDTYYLVEYSFVDDIIYSIPIYLLED